AAAEQPRTPEPSAVAGDKGQGGRTRAALAPEGEGPGGEARPPGARWGSASEETASTAPPHVPADAAVYVTPLFPVPGNAISNEPSAPLPRKHSGKGPGSLQPQQIGDPALRAEVMRTAAGW